MSADHTSLKSSASEGLAQSLFSDLGVHRSVSQWREDFPEIIGRSPTLLNVLESVSRIAVSDSSVLIIGPSGTGKELIASALHRLSPRAPKRFVPLNCSAIPESLLESELFGHEKGSFTGATARRPGHFEVANGGTLFLDEIGDMPLRLQAKLLRVLQEKQFTSVGGHQLKTADVRIIAATNIDLAEAIREGRFRLDLYYRLNVLPIQMPSLSQRKEDIPELLFHFLHIANRVNSHKPPCAFTDAVVTCLVGYDWPGNIRELQNLVERLVVTNKGGLIELSDLPAEYLTCPNPHLQTQPTVIKPASQAVIYPESFGSLPDQGLHLASFIEDLENKLIDQALMRTSNNKNQAAKLLGLNRTTLVERLKKRKIPTDDGL